MTLFHTCCEPLHRSGEGAGENEGEWEDDSSGGLIGHCVSPQPWREIDAHACGILVHCFKTLLQMFWTSLNSCDTFLKTFVFFCFTYNHGLSQSVVALWWGLLNARWLTTRDNTGVVMVRSKVPCTCCSLSYDSWLAVLCSLGNGSWLAWVNGTSAHHAAIHYWLWLTVGPWCSMQTYRTIYQPQT